MQLIKPSFEILEQGPGLDGIYKQIEKVGRTCYKSENLIKEGSAKPFVDRMIASKHYAMIEHGTIYLNIPIKFGHQPTIEEYLLNPHSRVGKNTVNHYWCITTNLRVLVENGWMEDLQYICEPTEHHIRRVTVKFICDRGVSHEFVRHRVFSFAQESTRYCNYSKDKFGNELTYILPCWWKGEEGNEAEAEFCNSLQYAEEQYFFLLNQGWTPQQARAVLPNSLKTELVMTGFVNDWEHFFDLRARGTTGAPHPQAKELAEPLLTEFIKRGILSL